MGIVPYSKVTGVNLVIIRDFGSQQKKGRKAQLVGRQ
jgi:hypothetical protein